MHLNTQQSGIASTFPPWDSKGLSSCSTPTTTSVDHFLVDHQLLALCETATFISHACGCEYKVILIYKAKALLQICSFPPPPK